MLKIFCSEIQNHFALASSIEMYSTGNIVCGQQSSTTHTDVLRWLRQKVSIFEFFRHSKGSYQGIFYDSDCPPQRFFRNNVSCRPFVQFIRQTILERLQTGAIFFLGKVGQVQPPHIILPLTIELKKPWLCYDARYLNLWMQDKPLTLDKLCDVPRYLSNESYQTVLDDKSGYDHIVLSEESRTFFGIQWGGYRRSHYNANLNPFYTPFQAMLTSLRSLPATFVVFLYLG